MDARERTCWDDRREALSAQCLRRACMQYVPVQELVTIFFQFFFFSFSSSNAKTKIRPFVNREMLERLSNLRVRIKDTLSRLSIWYLYCCASVDFIIFITGGTLAVLYNTVLYLAARALVQVLGYKGKSGALP